MTAQQRKSSYFPELDGDEQRLADEWLEGYLRLVVRIYREHQESRASYPQQAVDANDGTGNVGTANRPTSPAG